MVSEVFRNSGREYRVDIATGSGGGSYPSDSRPVLTKSWRKDKVTRVPFQQAEDRGFPSRICNTC
jgi:hypothetical protein